MSNYKNREIFQKIIDYTKIPEIIVLHGARQVGKTTLMKMTIEHLKKEGTDNIFYLDLEKEKYLELCNSGYQNIIKYAEARKQNNKKTYIFIDEIQYLDNPSQLLKILYDHYKDNYKIIVSGSSSFAIKSKFKDSLVGRTIDLEIFGLSFEEFLDFKNLKYNLNSDSKLAHDELKELFKDYMLYGFYPQIVLTDNIELKETYLENIIDKYIYKDIKDLANIKNIKKFNTLLRYLASQCGQLLNVKELSETLGMARQTIEEYLFILENTYIIKLIHPYYKNIRSELSKMPKIYFEDLGILNIIQNKELSQKYDGNFFENAVYAHLRRKFNVSNINFWRTTSKQEVDFIINSKTLTPIEVKLSYRDQKMRNLISFSEKYQTKNIFCITLNKNESKYKNIKQIYPWEAIKP